jgi:hypothetical protein
METVVTMPAAFVSVYGRIMQHLFSKQSTRLANHTVVSRPIASVQTKLRRLQYLVILRYDITLRFRSKEAARLLSWQTFCDT